MISVSLNTCYYLFNVKTELIAVMLIYIAVQPAHKLIASSAKNIRAVITFYVMKKQFIIVYVFWRDNKQRCIGHRK